jgi:hypothetical protein
MEKQMVEKLKTSEFVGSLQAKSLALNSWFVEKYLHSLQIILRMKSLQQFKSRYAPSISSERGDVPGWVLVVLMTTGLVTAIWTIAAPRLTSILKNSLDAMNGIR